MCGRYSFNVKKDVLKVLLPGVSLPNDWVESLNICPTEQALAIHKVDTMEISFMRWGFQQNNTIKKDLPPFINARSETIFEKVSFKGSVVNRRCIIPADSFYEWKIYGKSKIPYRILPSKDPVLFPPNQMRILPFCTTECLCYWKQRISGKIGLLMMQQKRN